MGLIIVGVDPGTTAAYAVLDDCGEFITSGSKKGLGISEMISMIISFGRPLIVSCDKAAPPGFVESIATKLGAKLFFPKEDLLVDDKRALIRNFDLRLNVHEEDALAAAVFAYKKHKQFLFKADAFLARRGKTALTDEFKIFAVRNEDLPFEHTLKLVEAPKRNKSLAKQISVDKTRIPQVKTSDSRVAQSTISELEVRIVVLEGKLNRLNALLQEKDELISRLRRRLSGGGALGGKEKRLAKIVLHKDQRIRHYAAELNERKTVQRSLTERIAERDQFIEAATKGILVKKLLNLGADEIAKKRFLNIQEGDVLLVKDPSVMSSRAVSELVGKVRVIITEKQVKNKLGFVFIPSAGVITQESENYAIADPARLDDAVRKKNILSAIVDEYKKEREKEKEEKSQSSSKTPYLDLKV